MSTASYRDVVDVSTCLGYDGVMAEPRWLDPTEARAWRGLLRMQWLLDLAISRDLAQQSALSHSDYEVLVVLSETEGRRLRMTELAQRLLWSRSRLSHQVARMEVRGLVARAGCAGDARGAFAVLTDLGLRTIEEAAPGHVESIRRHLFDGLRRDQVEALAELAEGVVDRLSTSCPRDEVAAVEALAACETTAEAAARPVGRPER